MAQPFADELAKAVGRKSQLTMYRSLRSTNRSMVKGRKDLYFAPPTVAVAAFDKGYSPIARVEDFIQVTLVRRKGANVTTVALTEKQSVPDVLTRLVLKENKEDVKFMNVKTQSDVILAMKRNYAQAGALGGKRATALLESSDDYEEWYPLPRSPGFTLVASNQLSESDRAKLEEAITSINPKVVQKMQKAFVAKLGNFVADKDAEFKTLHRAMVEAGYLEAK
ncbi:MAG TPA: PhnD/SsuA/transferrin family substrate-binding protein [Thiobacillus sp.]